MKLKVTHFDGSSREVVAEIHDDGVVEGDSGLAEHFREIVRELEEKGFSEEEYVERVFETVESRYNNGYYNSVRVDE